MTSHLAWRGGLVVMLLRLGHLLICWIISMRGW